jgi:nitrite reductase/ring-hydroxylating ferredoxin subunit
VSHPIPPAAACGACPLVAPPSDAASRAAVLGVDRRTFLSQATLAAVATALAACGGGGGGDVTAPSSVSGSVNVSGASALASVGGVQAVTVSGTPVAIVRTGTASFLALSRICPHQGTTVDVVSGGFHCPNHGARFDSTGRWTGGQPANNLTSYPTSYDATTGVLTIG